MTMSEHLPAPRSGGAPGPGAIRSLGRKPGFLRIRTNLFDRLFIGTVLLVAIHLLWMRFVEVHLHLGVATALSLVLIAIIARWG